MCELYPKSHKESIKGFKQGDNVVRCASWLVFPDADLEAGIPRQIVYMGGDSRKYQ